MNRRFRICLIVCVFVSIGSTNAFYSFGQNPDVPVPPAIPDHVQKVLEIEKILAQPVDPNVNFDDDPFDEVCKTLEFNVILDQSAMDDSLQMDTLITSPPLNRPISLDDFLTIILRQHNATFIVEENGLRVISLDSAMESHFFTTRFINCRSLLEKMDKNPKVAWNFRFPEAEIMANKVVNSAPQKSNNSTLTNGDAPPSKNDAKSFSQTEQLARLVIANVTPDEWKVTQGEGELQFFDGILVVNNSWDSTRRVEKFIRELEYAYFK